MHFKLNGLVWNSNDMESYNQIMINLPDSSKSSETEFNNMSKESEKENNKLKSPWVEIFWITTKWDNSVVRRKSSLNPHLLPPLWLAGPRSSFHSGHLDWSVLVEILECQNSSRSQWGCSCHLCNLETGCYFCDQTEPTHEMEVSLVYVLFSSSPQRSHQLEMILRNVILV